MPHQCILSSPPSVVGETRPAADTMRAYDIYARASATGHNNYTDVSLADERERDPTTLLSEIPVRTPPSGGIYDCN